MRIAAAAIVASVCLSGVTFAQQGAAKNELGDLSAAKLIEVRDGSSTAVLKGEFDHRQERDGDIDKSARLTGADRAYGEADIDVEQSGEAELEVEVRGLSANQAFSVWIDGRQVGSLKTNGRGRAEVEWRNR